MADSIRAKIASNFSLIILLFFALAIRIYSVAINGIGETVDTYNYIKQANLLINGKYSLYFPNGFPLIITLFIPLKMLINLTASLVILNIILSTITAYLVYKICKEAFKNELVSYLALVIIAFYPNQVKYVHWVLSEVPSAFFITLSLYFFVKKKYALSGAALGFASMIRTTLLPIGLFFTIYLFFKKEPPARRYFAFYALVPLIFLSYGYVRTGYFTIGQNAAHNLSISTKYSDTSSFPNVHLKNLNGSFSDYANFALKNPSEFLRDRLENLWDLWGPLPPLDEGAKWDLRFFWAVGTRFVLLLISIYGFITSEKNYAAVFSIIAISVITTVHLLYFADPRFTYTIEPVTIILASAGIAGLIKSGSPKAQLN
jgi:hypothetical protein